MPKFRARIFRRKAFTGTKKSRAGDSSVLHLLW
jgi:hypothetical protein